MTARLDIRLAGFNVDADILKSLPRDASLPLTPETLSAAYARISRSSLSVNELRVQARREVTRSRRSNSRIIFDMGHHSIAEHAVFNFDIMGISRLAMEEIESMRLVSFTEKSQRYVKLNGETLLPEEIRNSDLEQDFMEVTAGQNGFYREALAVIENHLEKKLVDSGKDGPGPREIRNLAKEDARYGLGLATKGQLGMTINARNLEHLLRKTSLSSLQEVRTVGEKLYELVSPVAPSLILFPEPSEFDKGLAETLPRELDSIFGEIPESTDRLNRTLESPENGDDDLLTALLSRIRGLSWKDAGEKVSQINVDGKQSLFRGLFHDSEFFDSMPREFEIPFFTFEVVVSASCFAQLKRHRMATILPGPYMPAFGYTIPEVFRETGLENDFRKIASASESAYRRIFSVHPAAAAYVLTNAHCRRVTVKMNLREIYHFVRLRSDAHAQWDIRNLSRWIEKEVQRAMPLASMILCGKSDFSARYSEIFNKKPHHRI